MPQKSAKIIDVQSSDSVTPDASSRPVIVPNRPMLNAEPMLAAKEPQEEKAASIAITTRDAKTIAPPDASTEDAAHPAEPEPPKTDVSDDTLAKPAEKPAEETLSGPSDSAKDIEPTVAAVDAAAAEADAKKAARSEELEKLAESGQYAVPIDAVGRKRSRMYVGLLCLLALVLAAVLFDIVLDAGVIKVSGIKPLTHFFGN